MLLPTIDYFEIPVPVPFFSKRFSKCSFFFQFLIGLVLSCQWIAWIVIDPFSQFFWSFFYLNHAAWTLTGSRLSKSQMILLIETESRVRREGINSLAKTVAILIFMTPIGRSKVQPKVFLLQILICEGSNNMKKT